MKTKKTIEITVPVYNEEVELETHVGMLVQYCIHHLSAYKWQITIADNASVDRTQAIGQTLSKKIPEVDYIRLSQKGRGRAIKTVWKMKDADISVYMDVDLSTSLDHLPKLIGAIDSGGYDIAIGSRLLKQSRVVNRTIKREVISRSYNTLVKMLFFTKISDAQCGFKAVSRDVVRMVLPYINDNEWFFDSELLIVSEKCGLKIYEEPVVWRDNQGTTVRVIPTAAGDIKGLLRVRFTQPWKSILLHG